MSDQIPEYANYAVLDDAGHAVEVDRETWLTWRISFPGGVLLKEDTSGDWRIETRFTGRSEAADGPSCYWQVSAWHPVVDCRLEYPMPGRGAAWVAHRILKFLVRKEAFREKLRAAPYAQAIQWKRRLPRL